MLVHRSILNGQIAQKIRSSREVFHHVQPIGRVLVASRCELLEKILYLRCSARKFFLCVCQLLFQLAASRRTSARQAPDEERCEGHRETRGYEITNQIRIHRCALHLRDRRHDGEW